MPPAPTLTPDEQHGLLRWVLAATGAGVLWLLGLGARKATPVLVDTAVEASVRRRFSAEIAAGAVTRETVERIDERTLRLELQQTATHASVERLEETVGRLTDTLLQDLRDRANVGEPVRTEYTLPHAPPGVRDHSR